MRLIRKIGQLLNLKTLGRSVFARFFGFEQNIDITDDVQVLLRRNIVMKNIIFVSNIMYSLLLFILSLSSEGSVTDWVVTVLVFPLTYVINRVLRKLIHMDKGDRTKQMVAMYVAAFYIFFSSILIYARLYRIPHFETGAYILMYYAVVVISLYQERRLLSGSFQAMLALLTAIHLIWTYNLQGMVNGMSFGEFWPVFVKSTAFSDILLRTILFILFYFVVYAIVSMGQYMQEERKKELIRRRQVQSDFAHIVTDLFSVVFATGQALMDRRHAFQVRQMAERLALDTGMSKEKIDEMVHYALIHLQFQDIRDLVSDKDQTMGQNYDVLKEKTELGSMIAKRLQLAQKCETIVRAHIEQNVGEDFVHEMLRIQPETDAQIILLSDLYITLREAKPYKRPHSHKVVMKLFTDDLHVYFDYELKERFLKFNDDFRVMYDEF